MGAVASPAGCGMEQAPTQTGVHLQAVQRQEACGVGAGRMSSMEIWSGVGVNCGGGAASEIETTETPGAAWWSTQPLAVTNRARASTR